MKINSRFTFILVCTMAITGCMSLEERLASNDPTIKRNAEYELVANSRRTGNEADRIAAIKRVTDTGLLMEIALTAHTEQKKKHGMVPSTIPDGMEALAKLKEEKILEKLAIEAESREIQLAAIKRISNQETLLNLYGRCYDMRIRKHILLRLNSESLVKVPYSTEIVPFWRSISDQRILAQIYRDGDAILNEIDKQAILDKLTDAKVIEEMIVPPSDSEVENHNRKVSQRKQMLQGNISMAEQRIETCMDSAKRDEENWRFSSAQKERAKAKRIKSEIMKWKWELETLDKTSNVFLYVGDRDGINVEKHRALLRKLPDDQIVEIALKQLDPYSEYQWNRHNVRVLEQVIAFGSCVKEEKNVLRILKEVVNKIESVRKACLRLVFGSWGNEDIKQATKLVERFPQISDAAYGILVCQNGMGWKYLLKKITPEVAYRILAERKIVSEGLEAELAKMLPAEKIDMKIYESVHSDAAQKIIIAKMSADMKKSVAEKNIKAFTLVEEKAKAAAKETFELQGFYLGMDWEDMKTVLAHHFPDLEIKEERDGESNDDDYIIVLPNQRSPFCYASANNKKVYQFNFGKKILKKWYVYDAQTFRDWAYTYSRESKIDMKYMQIQKEAEVHDSMDLSRSYRVWFHQESYQYKHNAKGYRLTYFGEEKDFTGYGGLGGALIKEKAASQFRYVRGDPGSLRAEIDND